MTPVAHIGHWYHVIFYLAPVLLIAGGLWFAGRKLPVEDEFDEFEEYDDAEDLGGLGATADR